VLEGVGFGLESEGQFGHYTSGEGTNPVGRALSTSVFLFPRLWRQHIHLPCGCEIILPTPLYTLELDLQQPTAGMSRLYGDSDGGGVVEKDGG
jgi:hypothetical protein